MSGSGPVYEYQRELTERLETALRERDEARAALAGAENSLTAEREFSARLSRECQERHDELRAEVERLREGIECHVARPGEGTYECSIERKCPACRLRHAEAEVERLRADLSYAERERDRWMGQVITVAERQREACAKQFEGEGASVSDRGNAEWVRKTPLVTEGDK